MTTFLAATVILFLLAGIWALLEHNQHRAAGMPHPPLGTAGGRDSDLSRIIHDLDLRR